MKNTFFKTISFVLVMVLAVASFSVSANAENMDFVLNLTIDGAITDTLTESDVEIAVYNPYDTAWLDTEIVHLSRGMTSFDVKFSVGQEFDGKELDIKLIKGAKSFRINGVETDKVTVCTNTALELVPDWNREAIIHVEGVDKTFYAHCFMDDELYVTTDLLSALNIDYEYTEDGMKLSAVDNGVAYTFDFYMNNVYAVKGNDAYNLNYAPFEIDEFGYVPLSDVAIYFACSYSVVEDTPYKREINLKPTAYKKIATKAEEFVNSCNLTSKTDYLVWVSKSEFTVYAFIGSNGKWRQVAAFPCAIGAPSTPTKEGVFDYYRYQDRWSYASYYCGPIMRYYGGYALHSTLIGYDGVPYDNRVGVKISHGCVRLRPANIQWLVDYVPLHSTIYVTA